MEGYLIEKIPYEIMREIHTQLQKFKTFKKVDIQFSEVLPKKEIVLFS